MACALLARPAAAAPFIWDQDQNRVDDRIELVNTLGFAAAFDQADTTLRQRIAVARVAGGLIYDVFVVYDHEPTSDDFLALTLLGMPVLHRFEGIPAARSVGTFAQVQAAAARSGVERVEAVPVVYPLDRTGAAAVAARDPSGAVFPTWAGSGGGGGAGVVIGFLDTGINDAPDGAFPGHESLLGRCLGGASFVGGDSTADTPPDGSVNPVDRGGAATRSHGTHVAGIALGSGGATGYATGVAPAARFVDVKVLNDAGVGTEVPEGLDWCIHNRARDWGDPDPALRGIDIVNLSLSSVDASDGQDVASRLASRAVELGIVVVASVGNDGHTAHVPSPGAGGGVITVGALDDHGTPGSGDDAVAAFGNRGPRATDGDGDPSDEEKPDLVAPGVAVLSADGDLTSDGAQYQRLTGTSMAAAFVSGAAALLRSAYPGLAPAQLQALLRATASRTLPGSDTAPGGYDPGWTPGGGFGALDLYAVRLEAEQPQRSQVIGLALSGSGATLGAAITTQRERGAAAFVIERAPDLAGVPGTFAPYDSAAAAGDSSLADGTNRTSYPFAWTVPPGERGATFWYRASYSEGGVRHDGPARRFTSPAGASLATLEITIAHNSYDSDVSGVITAGPGAPAPFSLALPTHSADAASSDWLAGPAAGGNEAWTFQVEVTDPAAAAWLPPDDTHPWRIEVHEGGGAALQGRLTGYRVVWHGPGGDAAFTGGPTPQTTPEGGAIDAVAPQSVLAVGSSASGLGPRVAPNPVIAGAAVRFVFPGPDPGALAIYDLGGRRVGGASFTAVGGAFEARWEARGAAGRPLTPGMYFARPARGPAQRVVVVGR